MSASIYGLIISFFCGLSFFIGFLIKVLFPNKKSLLLFSVGCAFVVLIGLFAVDLLPECISIIDKWYLILIYVLLGGLFLKFFDVFIPHHEHNNHHSHIEHISTISCIAIALHNMIECTLVYTTCISDLKAGLLMALGVACHNIPLSIEINSLTFSRSKGLIMTFCLALSSLVGSILFIIFNISLSESLIGILTCITLGMILYIVFFELLCEVKENIKKKSMLCGLFLGLLLVFLIFII